MNELTALEGRIDGIAHALLRLASTLEIEQLIDGHCLSEAWRNARPEHLAKDHAKQASRQVLLQLADLLDEARECRAPQ